MRIYKQNFHQSRDCIKKLHGEKVPHRDHISVVSSIIAGKIHTPDEEWRRLDGSIFLNGGIQTLLNCPPRASKGPTYKDIAKEEIRVQITIYCLSNRTFASNHESYHDQERAHILVHAWQRIRRLHLMVGMSGSQKDCGQLIFLRIALESCAHESGTWMIFIFYISRPQMRIYVNGRKIRRTIMTICALHQFITCYLTST